MEDSNKQSASGSGELSPIRLSSFPQTEINSNPLSFVEWLEEALFAIMSTSQVGQLLAEGLISGARRVGVRIFSDATEVAEVRWLQLAPHRLKLTISPHGALGHPTRRAGCIAYALLLELLQTEYPETGDLISRALPPDWEAQLRPERHFGIAQLVEMMTNDLEMTISPKTEENKTELQLKNLNPQEQDIARKILELKSTSRWTDALLAARLSDEGLTLDGKQISARQVKNIRKKAGIPPKLN